MPISNSPLSLLLCLSVLPLLGVDDCEPSEDELRASCLEIFVNDLAFEDGVYTIDPDGEVGLLPPMDVYCDMTTDGGGWTQIGNFVHPGDTGGVSGWNSGSQVGTDFTDPMQSFKMSDSVINQLVDRVYRVNGSANECIDGPCEGLEITRYWDSSCVYSSFGVSQACQISYRDPTLTERSNSGEPCQNHRGLISVNCPADIQEIVTNIDNNGGDQCAVGEADNWTHAYSGRVGEDPSLTMWVR